MKACESNSLKLSALADGELTGWAAWRLRQHLAGCAGCRQELADWETLARAMQGQQPKRVSFRPMAKTTRRRWILPGLVSAAAVVGGVALFGLLPGSPGNPSNAYAEVSDAMQKIRTAQWAEKIVDYDDTGRESSEMTTRIYEQGEPFVISRRSRDVRPVSSAWGKADFTMSSVVSANESREYSSDTGDVILRKRKGGRKWSELFTDQLSLLSVYAREQKASKKPGRTVTTERTTLDGRSVLLLTVKAPIFEGRPDWYEYRLWADEATKRVLRTEHKMMSKAGGVKAEVITDGYRYNEPIDSKLLALDAPADATAYEGDFPSAHVTEGQHTQIAHSIAEMYRGLERGDWKRFAANWDFGFAASLPHSDVAPGQQEASLHRMIDESRGRYQTYDAKTMAITHSTSTKIAGYGEANLPTGAPRLLAVHVQVRRLWKDGFDNGGSEFVYLRMDGANAPRVVGWLTLTPNGMHERWIKNGRHW